MVAAVSGKATCQSSYGAKSALDQKIFEQRVCDPGLLATKLVDYVGAQPALKAQRELIRKAGGAAHQKQRQGREEAKVTFLGLFANAPDGWKLPHSYKKWVFDAVQHVYVSNGVKAVVKGWPAGYSFKNPGDMAVQMKENVVNMIRNNEITCEFYQI